MFKRMLAVILCMFSVESFSSENFESEIMCLATNVYHEARGEDFVGQVAVAHVTMNRVNSKRFPDSVCGVVYQARYSEWWKKHHNKNVPVKNQCQFSWYCDGRSDAVNDTELFHELLILSIQVYHKMIPDNTDGSLFYHSRRVEPYWASSYNQYAHIGNHIFYNEK